MSNRSFYLVLIPSNPDSLLISSPHPASQPPYHRPLDSPSGHRLELIPDHSSDKNSSMKKSPTPRSRSTHLPKSSKPSSTSCQCDQSPQVWFGHTKTNSSHSAIHSALPPSPNELYFQCTRTSIKILGVFSASHRKGVMYRLPRLHLNVWRRMMGEIGSRD